MCLKRPAYPTGAGTLIGYNATDVLHRQARAAARFVGQAADFQQPHHPVAVRRIGSSNSTMPASSTGWPSSVQPTIFAMW